MQIFAYGAQCFYSFMEFYVIHVQNQNQINYIKPAKLNCYKHSFFIRIVKLWNNLPRDLVEAHSFQLF